MSTGTYRQFVYSCLDRSRGSISRNHVSSLFFFPRASVRGSLARCRVQMVAGVLTELLMGGGSDGRTSSV